MEEVKIIERKNLEHISDYADIFVKESHHHHRIVEIDGVVRWEEKPMKTAMVEEKGLNAVVMDMINLGMNKNSEEWRALYRNMGYSLSGYWEVFYWEVNNPIAENYS